MTLTEQLSQIEKDIKTSTEVVDFGNALERLRSNRDFKRVVLEGYFKDEAVRLVHLLSDPAMQTPEKQASIHTQMMGIGQMSQYFNTVFFRARQAGKYIADAEEMREELIAEEATSDE